jgi:hypothetical protein
MQFLRTEEPAAGTCGAHRASLELCREEVANLVGVQAVSGA